MHKITLMRNSIHTAVVLFAVLFAACGSVTQQNVNVNVNAGVGNSTPVGNSPSPTVSPTPESRISPTPSLSPLPPDAKGVQAAIDVVHEYYDAINARDYRRAYELWSGKGEASKQSFEEFRDGYANTESVEIDTSGEPGSLEGAAGSQYVKIPLRLKAHTKDGKVQNFWGEYTLRRSMVDGATPDQREWRIYAAEFKELP